MKAMFYDTGMSRDRFKAHFHRFHDLRKEVIQDRYQIYVPNQMHLFIKQLNLDHNNIVHAGREAKPIFENIELCCKLIIEYFIYIEKEIS
jgi:hypothetical protein